jgi:hypothetical protein
MEATAFFGELWSKSERMKMKWKEKDGQNQDQGGQALTATAP